MFCRCVMLFGFSESKGMVQKLFKVGSRVRKNTVFLHGRRHPNLWKQNGKRVWTKPVSSVGSLKYIEFPDPFHHLFMCTLEQGQTRHFVQCPVVVENARAKFELEALCRGNRCLDKDGRKSMACTNPLQGQVVRVQVYSSVPYVIPPVLFNNPLSGFTVRLGELLAEKLSFVPKFTFSRGGRYFPGNNSFGPGSYRSVNAFC